MIEAAFKVIRHVRRKKACAVNSDLNVVVPT